MGVKARSEPEPRLSTPRQAIADIIRLQGLSARELSKEVGVSERDVPDHLEHIRKSLTGTHEELYIVPAECRSCGFVFKERSRLKKPGRCPMCRSTSIEPPLFGIRRV